MLERLEKILEEKGIKQGELERVTGLPPNRVSKWRGGQGEPTAAQAARIARELGVSLEWLVEGRGEVLPRESAAGRQLTPDEDAVLGLIRGMKLSVGDVAERLAPKPAPGPRRSPRKRRQG